jgi:hypothetical protein
VKAEPFQRGRVTLEGRNPKRATCPSQLKPLVLGGGLSRGVKPWRPGLCVFFRVRFLLVCGFGFASRVFWTRSIHVVCERS